MQPSSAVLFTAFIVSDGFQASVEIKSSLTSRCFFHLMLKIVCQCVCVWTKSYHLIVYFVFIIYKVEYMLVKFDHENKKVRLVLCGEEVLQTLQDKGEKVNPKWVAVSCFFFSPVMILYRIL